MIKKISFILTIILFLSNCGFKIVDKSRMNDFTIQNINSDGDKRINFKIKNYLLNTDKKDSKNLLLIKLKTEKIKSIKEKNLKNEITKYQIVLNIKIDIDNILDNSKYTSNLSVSGDYLVGDNYSTTINNEKKLTDDLIDSLTKGILNKINLSINDL